MVRRLKRIGPLKFGMVIGIVYALISLVFIPFFLVGILAGMFIPSPHLQQGTTPQLQTAISLGVGLFFCVLAPILYGGLGFLFGALIAWVYNVVATWTGGIEFEVE
jgi:hypothetical protein